MSWLKDITKEFEHMHVAGGEKRKHGGDASYGYPGQGASYTQPPGQYYAQPGYPPPPPPAQSYGYVPPPAQTPYGDPSYPAPPPSYGRPPPPAGYGAPPAPSGPPSLGATPPPQSYAPPSTYRDTGYGAPTPGVPPPAYEPPPLPPGWSVHWDAYRGRPYYVEIASRRTEWFLPSERDPAVMRGSAVGGPVGQVGKDKAGTKGHGTGALVAAGAAGVVGGALLGGLAVHEEHKLKGEWDEERDEWKRDWNEGRQNISEAGQEFHEEIREDEQSAFRKAAEVDGEYKAYEEEAYEDTLDDDGY